MTIFLLLVIAAAPPLVFLIYILYMDRNEPEPIGFIIKIFFFGMLSIIPAAFVELSIESFMPFLKITTLT